MNDSPSRIPRVAACAGALLLTLAAAVPVSAQAPAEPGRTAVSTTVGTVGTAPAPPVADGQLRLSLDDAIEIALRQNLDLALQRYDRTINALVVPANQGLFDLRVRGSYTLQEDNQPNTTQLEGAAVVSTEQRSFTLGLDQLTAWGGEASLDVVGSRGSTNSTNAFINPEYFASETLSFTQPLLRRFGELATKRPILQARLTSEISRESFELEATRVIQAVENAYWALVEAQDQLGVAQESLDLANELHQRNRVQVEVGTLAPIEMVGSEANVATRQEGIIAARAAVGDATDALLELLNLDRTAYWDLEVVPTTEPETETIAVDLDQAIATALAERPELAVQNLTVEQRELDARFFHRDKLPSLDFVLSYGGQGVAGRGVVPDPETGDLIPVDNDLTDAFDDAAGFDFDQWSAQLVFSHPIQNRTARAQAAIADLDLGTARTALEQLRLRVVTEVRAATRRLETAAQQIESARVSRRLQERNLEAEQRRYENGMSTSFQVTQIQEDLTGARAREVSAVTGYRNALAEFYRVTGRLLEVTGVVLVEDDLPQTAGWQPPAGTAAAEPEAAGTGMPGEGAP